MIEKFIHLKIRDDGRLEEVQVYTKHEVLSYILPATRPRKRINAFLVEASDEGDVLILKQAVEAVGGPSRLSGLLGASVAAVYNWLRRETIPVRFRGKVAELAASDNVVQLITESDECEG